LLLNKKGRFTEYLQIPKYLVHDNDSIFTSIDFQSFLKNINITSKRTSIKSPWQNGICERAVGIIRQDLLNHIIPINEKHLTKLLKEYIEKYYNPERTHQGINCETPIYNEKPFETKVSDTFLEAKPILNELYHSYKKVV
jgi:transposase InsO family protein